MSDSSLTVLDRLLSDPSNRGGIRYSIDDAVRESIARDLEVLLNSRLRGSDLVTAEFPECCTSILNFGVPEFDQYGNLSVEAEQVKLCLTFAAAIRTFEPRLQSVSVELLPAAGPGNALRYRIKGVIATRNEVGIFDAGLEPVAGLIKVSPGGGS